MAFGWIDEQARLRRHAGLVRTLRPRPAVSPLLDLASNDYLGLAHHPEVTEGAARAARVWGGGSTGSRLVTGSTELHAELEQELADFCGAEAALVFSSGYAANLAAVTALAPHGSLIVSDAGNHASLIDGCRLALRHDSGRGARRAGRRAQGAAHAPGPGDHRVRHGLLGRRRRGPARRARRGVP
ncbi:8-amino-7-oxononanoate synthase [Streptomyces violarus]